MQPVFFESSAKFRTWLKKNHRKEKELLVGFRKISTGTAGMTWSQSVDEALCFGWIDGVRTSIDENSYQIRFTPRKPGSIWSAVNINKAEALQKQGLMQPAGWEIFQKRTEAKSKIYAHEKKEALFTPAQLKVLKANKAAWTYFQALAPSYQKLSAHWVNSAKQEATQQKRMAQIIDDCAQGTNQWK